MDRLIVWVDVASDFVWKLSDVLNGLMALPNLIGLILLSGLAARITRDYLGSFKPVDGAFTLRAEVVGTNAKSEEIGSYFGLDCVVISKEKGNIAPHGEK